MIHRSSLIKLQEHPGDINRSSVSCFAQQTPFSFQGSSTIYYLVETHNVCCLNTHMLNSLAQALPSKACFFSVDLSYLSLQMTALLKAEILHHCNYHVDKWLNRIQLCQVLELYHCLLVFQQYGVPKECPDATRRTSCRTCRLEPQSAVHGP